MRLTLALLGWELDITLGPESPEAEDAGSSLDGGTTASTPIGFSLPTLAFGEMDCPPHQWEPEDE